MQDFKLPSLGADMDEGTLLEWKVKAGDVVKKGDVLAVVDTTKAAIDVESWVEGIVHELVAQPGETVPVGAVLARLRASGEEVAGPSAAAAGAPREGVVSPGVEGPIAGPVSGEPAPVVVPRQPPTTPPAEPSVAPVAPPAMTRRPVSPVARRRAAELGLNAEGLAGTGPQGAVTLDDVERAAAGAAATVAAPRSAPTERARLSHAAAPAGVASAAPRDRGAEMRKTIGAAMARAKREIPHYYLAEPIPLAAATAWLAGWNAQRPITERVLLAALLLKAIARAARKYPEVNGYYRDGHFEPASAVHVGVAISIRGGGLIAPAIHDCDGRPLDDLMRALADLVQRARAGSLRSSELSDATITVTNLGEQSVAEVYGVIYPPQVALVGFGRVADEVVADSGSIRVVPVIHASLSADHRVSDGHRGALFLAHVRALLQNPAELAEETT
jgi:pyruvate dehydrogenase E2 component (dihydrolipoamide acetyltransferase)